MPQSLLALTCTSFLDFLFINFKYAHRTHARVWQYEIEPMMHPQPLWMGEGMSVDPKAISFTFWLLLRGRCKFIILFKFCNEQRQPREIATTKHHNTLLKEKHFFLMISYKCTQWVLDQRLHPPSHIYYERMKCY